MRLDGAERRPPSARNENTSECPYVGGIFPILTAPLPNEGTCDLNRQMFRVPIPCRAASSTYVGPAKRP